MLPSRCEKFYVFPSNPFTDRSSTFLILKYVWSRACTCLSIQEWNIAIWHLKFKIVRVLVFYLLPKDEGIENMKKSIVFRTNLIWNPSSNKVISYLISEFFFDNCNWFQKELWTWLQNYGAKFPCILVQQDRHSASCKPIIYIKDWRLGHTEEFTLLFSCTSFQLLRLANLKYVKATL